MTEPLSTISSIAFILVSSFGLAMAIGLWFSRDVPLPWRDPDRDETACTLPEGWDDADEELAAAAREMAEAETVEMEAVRA